MTPDAKWIRLHRVAGPIALMQRRPPRNLLRSPLWTASLVGLARIRSRAFSAGSARGSRQGWADRSVGAIGQEL
jgi:hypothetical protein